MSKRKSSVKATSCEEAIESLEERVKWAKEDVERIWSMIGDDAISYSAEDACIGHVYRKLYYAKKHLKNAQKRAKKQNKGDK